MTPAELREAAKYVAERMRNRPDVQNMCQWVMDQNHKWCDEPITRLALLRIGGTFVGDKVEFAFVSFKFTGDTLVELTVREKYAAYGSTVVLPAALHPQHIGDVQRMLDKYYAYGRMIAEVNNGEATEQDRIHGTAAVQAPECPATAAATPGVEVLPGEQPPV